MNSNENENENEMFSNFQKKRKIAEKEEMCVFDRSS